MMRQNLLTQEKFNIREREREREKKKRRRKIHVKTKTYFRMACIHEMELLTHLVGP